MAIRFARHTGSRAARGVRFAVCLAPLVLACGCAAFPTLDVGGDRPTPRPAAVADARPSTETMVDPATRRNTGTMTIPGPTPPAPLRSPATDAEIDALVADVPVDAAIAPQTIPQFVATVFGGIIQVPYTMAPDVAQRTEVIAGGTGGQISKRAMFKLARRALAQYGVDIFIDGPNVTVGRASTGGAAADPIVRGRSIPGGAGRVVQIFNVQTIEVSALQALLRDLYPNLTGARIVAEPTSNSLIISGGSRDVASVVRALREIDRPAFSGADVVRVEPVYRSAEEMALALEQVLTTEGYYVSRQAIARRAVVMIPFPAANQLLIFVQEPELKARVEFWVDQLDRPAALGDKTTTFVYQVKNTDAQSLAALAQGQTPALPRPSTPVGVPGTPPARQGNQQDAARAPNANTAQGQMGNGIIADPIGNRILFTGTATAYAQFRDLLEKLDVPAPQVVIEVIIAEVTLNDSTSLGVSLFGSDVRGDGTLVGSTEGLELGGGALALSFTGADYRVRLAAQASNDRVNILQRPQLVTRSGQTARFQVGTDVPIITSQRALDTSTGGNGSDVLQTVQYRQTGTILELTPVVYGDRVDITIQQELSEVGTSSGAISSPAILNRSLSTQIALTDGWTGVLGGLISNGYDKVNTGVPFLKDIPGIGSLFQTNTVEGSRSEILILVTPHILRSDDDMADLVDSLSSDIDAAFRTGRGWSYTLTPWSAPGGFRGVGFDLPRPARGVQREIGRDSAVSPDADALPAESEAPATEPAQPPAA